MFLVVVREAQGHGLYECDGKTADTGVAPTITRLLHDDSLDNGGHFERLIPIETYEAAKEEVKRRRADAERDAMRRQREQVMAEMMKR